MSAPEVDTESVVAAGMDGWAIAVVRGLRHREGTRHTCKCEECKSIVRVCALATERLAMSQRKGKRRDHARSEVLLLLLKNIAPSYMDRIIDRLDKGQCEMMQRVFDGYVAARPTQGET